MVEKCLTAGGNSENGHVGFLTIHEGRTKRGFTRRQILASERGQRLRLAKAGVPRLIVERNKETLSLFDDAVRGSKRRNERKRERIQTPANDHHNAYPMAKRTEKNRLSRAVSPNNTFSSAPTAPLRTDETSRNASGSVIPGSNTQADRSASQM